VQAVIDWVEASSSWDETLVVVTADHETGYLTGPGSDPGWTPLTGRAGEVAQVQWNSEKHTNTLVPLFAQGAGARDLLGMTEGNDPVRGPYLDNTDLPHLILDELWQ
jgi:alkaline phosphatase